jgi:putative peptidoglycan lipid II flippase
LPETEAGATLTESRAGIASPVLESPVAPGVPTMKGMAGSAGIVMASIIVSRFLGFLREWTVAHQVGSNALTDTYYAAFTLPDFLNYLVAGASLSVIFIPVFIKYVSEGREDEAWHVFSTVVTFMTLLMIGAVILGEILAPQIVQITAPGFPPAEKARVVFLTRLMLPAQICFVVGSILCAVQYAKNRFLVPSLASVVYNLFIVLGGWTLARRIGMTGFALGVLAGAIFGNLLLQIYGASRTQPRFRPNLNLRHPGFKLFLKLAIPIMLALSLTWTDNWITRWFGSYLQAASITWLTYAKILMQVPLISLGTAVGVVSFPVLTRLYSEGKFDEMNRLFSASLKGYLVLIIPLSALMVAQSQPLTYLVFAHTRLHGPDFTATAAALSLFSLGMFAWGAQYLLSRGFYAIHNTWTPAVVGTLATLATLPLYSLLVHRLNYLGLALASSLGILVYMLVLFVLLSWKTHSHEAARSVTFFFKIASASALASWVTFTLDRRLEMHLHWRNMSGAFMVLVAGTAVGLILTVIVAKLLRVREVDATLNRVRQVVGRRLGRARKPQPAV